MVPTVLDSSSAPDSTKPIYALPDRGRHHAVRLVFRTASGAYWGDRGDDWDDAPVLVATRASATCSAAGRTTSTTTAPKLHMIVLHEKGSTYWVVNSLLDNISNETMIAIAKGLKPLKARFAVARIAFFGAGYAGLVSGACLAELGHTVVIRDVAPERIEALTRRPRPVPRARSRGADRREPRAPVLHAVDGGGCRRQRVPVRMRRHPADAVGRRQPVRRSGR